MPSINNGPASTQPNNPFSYPIYSGVSDAGKPVHPGNPGDIVKNLRQELMGPQGSQYVLDSWQWFGDQWVERYVPIGQPATTTTDVTVIDSTGANRGAVQTIKVLGNFTVVNGVLTLDLTQAASGTGGTGTGTDTGDNTQNPPGTVATPAFDAQTLSAVLAAIASGAAGSKRLAGWTQFSTILGANWNVVLRQDGTVRYRAKYTAAFTPAATFSIPQTPNTVTTNSVADLSVGTWTIAIEKDGDASRFLLATLGSNGAGKQVSGAANLDNTKSGDFSQVVFTFPEALDITASATRLSVNDPRVLSMIDPSQPWNASIAGTKWDHRIQADSQYTASNQLTTPGTRWNNITTVRTPSSITWNGYDILRRNAVDPGGQPGASFYMALHPPVAWDADPTTARAILSCFGETVPYDTPFRWAFSIEPRATSIGPNIAFNIANCHYGGDAPGNQQPFDILIGGNGKLLLSITWADDNVPARGGQQQRWDVPLLDYFLQVGHRYYFEVQCRIKNNNTGYLQIRIRDGLAGTVTLWVNYTGPLGWPGGTGKFGPKWGPYDYSDPHVLFCEIDSDGSVVVLDREQTGYPSLTTAITMDTVAYYGT